VKRVIVAGLALIAVVIVALLAMVGSVVAEYPWLAGNLQTQIETNTTLRLDLPDTTSVDTWTPIVPDNQRQLIVDAANGSSCGVSAQDLAAIAQTESSFGKNLFNPISGAFGYGQFDAATWAAFGSGNPDDPADALPAIARTLCARDYGSNRVAALNSYGGCVTANCLSNQSYAQQIDQLASTLVVTSPVVANARTWLGVPYLFGGCSRAGIDCSCLTQLVYQAVGESLPRTAQQQWNATPRIAQSALQSGDLVFFANTYPSADTITHVGVYEGNGLMVNAPDTGQTVSEMSVFSGFWGSHYAGAGRP
jgi:cell wall-associated NlpC family hydrolase